MNVVILSGRTTKPNELKYLNNGKELLNNTLAVRREFKNANGEVETDFINLIMFGSTAKFIAEYAPKGSLIEVRGRWQHRTYQDNQGNTRYVDECIVESASLLIKNGEKNGETVQEEQPQSEQYPFNEDSDLPF